MDAGLYGTDLCSRQLHHAALPKGSAAGENRPPLEPHRQRSVSAFEAGGRRCWLNIQCVQRLTYLAVVFGLFPAILWTGLAMSFGVTSVFPILATGLGGHQSARTLHFVCVVVLLFFVVMHILM